MLVGKRRRLLKYLSRTDIDRYRALIAELGLRRMIEAGAPAPDFTLPDQDGNEVSLADCAGQTVVLVFYPLDFCPTCTDQLNVYQEVIGELEERGAKLSASRWTPRSATRPSRTTSASRSRCWPTSTPRARWPRPTACGRRTTA